LRITPATVDVGAEVGESAGERGDGLALAGDVEDEDDGQAQGGGEIGGRAGRAVGAVEQAHDAFDQQEVGGGIAEDAGDGAGAHGPGVEIRASAGAGDLVEARVDVVGADFSRGHGTAGCEGAQEGEGHDSLARARGGSRDDEGARHPIGLSRAG
jgi:hypothetical protein